MTRVRVPISTARARLFQLTDLVSRSGGDTAVVFEQRGGAEPVALVREARLAYLEERVRQMEKNEERATPFALAGSLVPVLDDEALEEALREIRKGWAPTPGSKQAPTRRRR